VSSRGVFGFGWESKYEGAETRGALLGRHLHGDHVALEELAEVNARVETGRDEVAPSVVLARDVEDDVRIVAGERLELRTDDRRQHHGWRDEADDARRTRAEPADLDERRGDALKRGTQLHEQALPRLGRRDGARRAREQPQTEALLERLHRVADRGAADAEPDGRPGEAALVGDHRKGAERAELVARDW
jgi:hypothetical protein